MKMVGTGTQFSQVLHLYLLMWWFHILKRVNFSGKSAVKTEMTCVAGQIKVCSSLVLQQNVVCVNAMLGTTSVNLWGDA